MLLPIRQRALDHEFGKVLGVLRQPSKLCTDTAARVAVAVVLDGFAAAVELDPRVPESLRLFDSLCDEQTDKAKIVSDCRSLRQAMPPEPAETVDPPGTKRAQSFLENLLCSSTLVWRQIEFPLATIGIPGMDVGLWF